MKTKNIFRTIASVALSLVAIASCEPYCDPLENEQYVKEVYLVGAAQDIFERELSYSGDGSIYISAAVSGTTLPDQDITVTVGTAGDAKMSLYNYKNFGENDVKYQAMPVSWYTFPSTTGVIRAGEVYCRIPFTIDVAKLHADSLYVIPLRIVSLSAYTAVTTDTTLLFHPKMVNDYSGTYQFEGVTCQVKDGDAVTTSAQTMTTTRNATAINANTVRLFQKTVVEKTANVADNAYNITVNGDNSLTVKPYDKLALTDGGGTYDPSSKTFSFWYDYKEGKKQYRLKATLTPPKNE